MKKVEKEYRKEYGHISRIDSERYAQLLQEVNLSKKERERFWEERDRLLYMKWKTVSYIIYLIPNATPRPRINRASNIFYVKGASDNKELFQRFLRTTDIDLITTPCKFFCNAYLPIPKSMSSVEKLLAELHLIRPISKPDFDNMAKTYSDMIQGSLLYDDALIIEGISRKFYSSLPRIEITIQYMEGYDSKFNERKMRKKV